MCADIKAQLQCSVQWDVQCSGVTKNGTKNLRSAPASKPFPFIAWKGTEASVHLGGKLSARLVWRAVGWAGLIPDAEISWKVSPNHWLFLSWNTGLNPASYFFSKNGSWAGRKCGLKESAFSKGKWCFIETFLPGRTSGSCDLPVNLPSFPLLQKQAALLPVMAKSCCSPLRYKVLLFQCVCYFKLAQPMEREDSLWLRFILQLTKYS